MDYGAMRRFDEYCPSDNTDALDRLYMQEWYSYLYPVKYMRAWLTDDFGMNQRKIPLKFSMYSAMCGSFGIGTDLNQVPEEKLEEIAGYVALYKEIRDIIQLGDVYRLRSFRQGDLHAIQYVRNEESAVFVFLDHERYGEIHHSVCLRGLQEDRQYRCTLGEREEIKSGAYLMQMGLGLTQQGDYDCQVIRLREIK